ncbi:MAG: YihY/virulence factor BrkB family protein, partial [Pseudomonadota bacterium]|nr:YihY/virulence factor BrkB family protein [Pseudomonadota bacterium]
MTLQQMWLLSKEAVSAWSDDYAPSMGAALAYYTLFSIAPLLLIVIALAGLVFGEDAARGQIFGELRELMGEQGALAVQGLLQNVNRPSAGVAATVVGSLTLLIGAMSVFGELQNSLDRIWRAPVSPGGSNVIKLLRTRLLSFGMVLGIGFLLIVSLVASAGLAALGKWWAPAFGDWAAVGEGLNFALSFATVTASFAMIYKVVPRVRVQWLDVWIGAAVTALLFTFGKFLIGFYIGRATFASGFGAAASLVVLLVWMYYSAQV